LLPSMEKPAGGDVQQFQSCVYVAHCLCGRATSGRRVECVRSSAPPAPWVLVLRPGGGCCLVRRKYLHLRLHPHRGYPVCAPLFHCSDLNVAASSWRVCFVWWAGGGCGSLTRPAACGAGTARDLRASGRPRGKKPCLLTCPFACPVCPVSQQLTHQCMWRVAGPCSCSESVASARLRAHRAQA
jgi:hypothetical protein